MNIFSLIIAEIFFYQITAEIVFFILFILTLFAAARSRVTVPAGTTCRPENITATTASKTSTGGERHFTACITLVQSDISIRIVISNVLENKCSAYGLVNSVVTSHVGGARFVA